MRQGGSIVKKRNRYYVVYRDLEKKQKWVGGFERKAEAQQRLTELLGGIQKGDYFKPKPVLFSDFAEQWLKNRLSIGGQTWENYQSYLKRHEIPAIGKVPMTVFDHSTVQALISQLSQKKVHTFSEVKPESERRTLSSRTIKKIASMLSTLFRAAVKEKVIRINPARDLELPQVVKKEVKPPQKEDVLQILEQAPAEVRFLFQLEAMTGLRRGEMLALQWHDIDWVSGELLRYDGQSRRSRAPTARTSGAMRWGPRRVENLGEWGFLLYCSIT